MPAYDPPIEPPIDYDYLIILLEQIEASFDDLTDDADEDAGAKVLYTPGWHAAPPG